VTLRFQPFNKSAGFVRGVLFEGSFLPALHPLNDGLAFEAPAGQEGVAIRQNGRQPRVCDAAAREEVGGELHRLRCAYARSA
jgi:hypothetical protein